MNLPLREVLQQHSTAATQWVERAIFGTSDPARMADLIAHAIMELIGVPVAESTFYGASSGCVLGIRLADGQLVVCKVYQPHWELPFLQAVQRTQRAVHQSGFPCPLPLAGPVPLGLGLATLESNLPDPGQSRPDDDGLLERSSSGLVQLIGAARGVAPNGLDLHPFRLAPDALYPTPHSPIFDLPGTSEGAEWIDEIARAAWSRRESGDFPAVIAHLDWSARNVRLDRHGLTAVYDWDSLSLAPETVAAGQAAATWRSTGESDDVVAPGSDEIERFLAAFGAARGRPLSTSELSAACGAATWVMAYTARCEDALEQRTPYRRDRARRWLRTQAGRLL